MRLTPASEMKKQTRRQINSIPREGSKIRALYDLFHSNKGQVIDFASPCNDRPLADLTDYYGLDIRRVSRGKWVLAGEWVGRIYLDYISEHLASKEGGRRHDLLEKEPARVGGATASRFLSRAQRAARSGI